MKKNIFWCYPPSTYIQIPFVMRRNVQDRPLSVLAPQAAALSCMAPVWQVSRLLGIKAPRQETMNDGRPKRCQEVLVTVPYALRQVASLRPAGG